MKEFMLLSYPLPRHYSVLVAGAEGKKDAMGECWMKEEVDVREDTSTIEGRLM